MRIEGATVLGRGRIVSDEEARVVLSDCLRDQPRVARFYGLEPDTSGVIDEEDLERLLEQVAIIVVTPQPIDVDFEPADVAIPGF